MIEVLNRNPVDREEEIIHKEYELKANRLYRRTDKGKRWVVPKKSRRETVTCHHNDIGHFGLDKTLSFIQSKYWFPNMRKYVKRFIDCCLPCLYNKTPSGKQSGLLNVIDKIAMPMDTLHLDHLGPFVNSSQKNKYSIVDGFTNIVYMKAVKSTKVEPVINFMTEIFNIFGVPRRIICDRGSCFASEKFTEFCNGLNLKRILNATATPRANG